MTEPTVHQLYCTHCTYRTSYQHQRSDGQVADQSAGYGIRDGSIDSSECETKFKQVEPFMYYRLPGDMTMDQTQKLEVETAAQWRRLIYAPIGGGGVRMVAHVGHRLEDTQGRPNSYFAHVLLDAQHSNGSGSTAVWTARDAAQMWGSTNWNCLDQMDRKPLFDLRGQPAPTLSEFRDPQTAVTDEALVAFLTKDSGTLRTMKTDENSVDLSLIPDRWCADDMPPEKRQGLLISVMNGFLQLETGKSQSVLLAIEPCLAALLFYGVARLLPRTGIGEQLSFSTFEKHQDRPRTALAATTFSNPAGGELPREASMSRGYAINTYRSWDPSSIKPKWKYPQAVVERLTASLQPGDECVDCGENVAAVKRLIEACESIPDVDSQGLDDMLLASELADHALSRCGTPEFKAQFKQLSRSEAREYVQKSAGEQLGTKYATTPSVPQYITPAPPPPGQKTPPAPSDGTPPTRPPLPPGSTSAANLGTAVKPAAARAKFDDLLHAPDHCVEILKLVAYRGAELGKSVEDAWEALANELIDREPETAAKYIADSEVDDSRRLSALRWYVENTETFPTDCHGIWITERDAQNKAPLGVRMLVELVSKPEPSKLSNLGSSDPHRDSAYPQPVILHLLNAQPDVERITTILKCLVGADADPTLLPGFVKQVATEHAEELRDVLRKDVDKLRKPVFERCVSHDTGQSNTQHETTDDGTVTSALENLVRAEFDEIESGPKHFEHSLAMLQDGRDVNLLTHEEERRLKGWEDCGDPLREIARTLRKPPGRFALLMPGTKKEYNSRLIKSGKTLAECVQPAMPQELWATKDPDGSKRADIVLRIARIQLRKSKPAVDADVLRSPYRKGLARVFRGEDWDLPARWSKPDTTPAPTTSSASKRSNGSSEGRRYIPSLSTVIAVVVLAATVGGGLWGYRFVQKAPDRAIQELLTLEGDPQRVGQFSNLSPAEVDALVTRMKSDNGKDDKVLLGLLQGVSADQLTKVANSDQRVALVSAALSIMPGQGVDPAGQFELLLKLPQEERNPALLRLGDQQMLGRLLANGPHADRHELFEPLDEDQRNALLDELSGGGLTELLKRMSTAELGKLPKRQLARLKPTDITTIISALPRPAERNALLARFGGETVAKTVMQLAPIFQDSLNDRVLARLPDSDLVKLLQKFDGDRLKTLLTRVDKQRRHDLDLDARKQIANGESAEIQHLLALNAPAGTGGSTGGPENTLVSSFVGMPATERNSYLDKLTGRGQIGQLLAGLVANNRGNLIDDIPPKYVTQVSVTAAPLHGPVASADLNLMCTLLRKIPSLRRVEVVLALKNPQMSELASLADSPLIADDTAGLMQNDEQFARLLSFAPVPQLNSLRDKLKLTRPQIELLAGHSQELAKLWGKAPAPAVVSGKNPEGHRIVYLELPAVPKASDPSEHGLGRIAPQAEIRGLELHGIGFMSRTGEQGLGPEVKQFKTKNRFEFEVTYHANADGIEPLPLCKFWVEPQGDLKFVWHCEENPEHRLATEMIHCSVLEIDLLETGANSQFFSFLKPIQIPARLTVDPTRDAKKSNQIYWLLPDAEKHLLHLRGWPLLVSGLTVHVPRDGKRYSPAQEDLRNRMPRLDDFRENYKVGNTQLVLQEVVESGISVPSVALKVLPNEKSPQDDEKEKATEDTLNDLKRALAKAQVTGKNKGNTRLQGVLGIAAILGISRPKDKDGTDFPYDSVNFRVFGERTMPEAAERRITQLEGELVTLSQRRTSIRDGLFESGLTISGSIYRVVGDEWARTTESKVEGGVIVKAFEIADHDPKPKQ